MFSKIWASSVLVSALCLQVTAHAIISPALGITGTPVRSDAQRPSVASPCGRDVTNIASAIDSATAVPADASGSFQVNATSFNGGVDGSLKFKAQVDASGIGTHFVKMTITTNGNNSPAGVGSQNIVASLPAGTKCTGGKAGNLCLVQLISGAGFGNCVVVSQAAAGNSTITDAGNSTITDAGNSTNTPAAGHCSAINTASTAGATGAVTPHAGSLMARSLFAGLGYRGQGAVEMAKRDTSG